MFNADHHWYCCIFVPVGAGFKVYHLSQIDFNIIFCSRAQKSGFLRNWYRPRPNCDSVPVREQFGFLTRIRLNLTKSHEIKVSVKFIANHDQNHCNLAPEITQFGDYCRSRNDFNVIFRMSVSFLQQLCETKIWWLCRSQPTSL